MDFLLVGVVTKAHGLKGEVVVEPHFAASPLWKPGVQLFAVARDVADRATDKVALDSARALRMSGCRKQVSGGETRWLCLFEGVAERDAADALRGTHLAIAAADVPPAGADEFYHHELRGLTVIDPTGRVLGTVVGVLPGPGQDLLEVAPPSLPASAEPEPDTWFVPFVAAIVGEVDRVRGTIVIDPPEGLVPEGLAP